MYKYYCYNSIAQVGLDKLGKNFEQTENVEEANGIILRSYKMEDIPTNVDCISRAGIGVNNVPVDKCTEMGIPVFNTPGGNANAVKELVIAGMLLSSRDIIGGINWVRENADNSDIKKLAEKEKKQFAGHELAGKSIGVIGLGSIGAMIANACYELGMDVYGYDPYLSINAAWRLNQNVHRIQDINELFELSDYITIHVPCLPSTENTINAEAIEHMKDDVVILNFSRDKLVSEKDVLDSAKVKYYVTDFANPTVASNPKCIVTPHLGASTAESEDNCAIMAAANLADYLENGNIHHAVNYPVLDMGVCKGEGRICILHKNVANMITRFAKVIGYSSVNIANMTNKSKDDVAYTVVDVDSPVTDDVVEHLNKIEEVYKVRIVK
ncbi:MAG: 3-phosphoglycerate dehydrogenase family protein [Coriobacteriia bacterium]|nr:3-phosphoglycerate dehydrogenase family protein [Coriobacteriia bacterium]